MLGPMRDLLKLMWWVVSGFFRSRSSLEAEIVALRHQLNVLRRKAPKRLVFSHVDRFIFASLYRIAPGILNALVIVKPETVIRWHRSGFRLFWRWKSRSRGGRPKVPRDIRQLMARRDGPSDCRMGCKATYRGLWLGAGARIPGSGSRLCLRRNFYPVASGHGHSRPANCASLTLAKWVCGTADWL